MPPIDKFVNTMVHYGASAVVLAADKNVTLRFPTGNRVVKQVTQQDELETLVAESAPGAVQANVHRGKSSAFDYSFRGKPYRIEVEVNPGEWTVTIAGGSSRDAAAGAEQRASGASGEEQPRKSKDARESPPVARRAGAAAPSAEAAASAGKEESQPIRGAGTVARLLAMMKKLGSSDLHLCTDHPPYVRVDGRMQIMGDTSPFSADALLEAIYEITPRRYQKEFEDLNDTDFAFELPEVSRFRVNLFRDRLGPGAVFRAIPFEILSPVELGLPTNVMELCDLTKGLVLVTGPTGSGKSTTLASLVDHINKNRDDHIITIEDPVEFVHATKRCLINQREVHQHTKSFKNALRAALREDPDIVLVGEMRDLETVAIAVETAETGHLVFGTLHTTTAAGTVDRIIDQFPADRQGQIRQMLAESLRGVIAQTLCRRRGGGRVAAYEILIGNNAVSNMIREKKTFQLPSLMQTGHKQGMRTLNGSLLQLVRDSVVDPDEALMRSMSKGELRQSLEQQGIRFGRVGE